MDEQPQVPQPREVFFVIIAGFFGTLLVMQVVILLLVGSDPEAINANGLAELLAVVGELGLAVFPVLYLRKKDYSLQRLFRWNPVPGRVLLLSLPLGAALTILGDELDRLIQMFIPMPDLVQEMLLSLKAETPLEWILMILGAVVIAALVEESIIRGLLQISLEHYQNVTRAVIYASLIWTAIHMMIYWAVQIFLLGVILGYLAWRTNSIWPSALCHGMNNAAALLFLNLQLDQRLPGYLWNGHVSPLLVLPALILVVKIIQYLDGYYRLAAVSESSELD
ncbi:MAG: CPBP family intramembrane metalloprotease [Calditrichaeota bacterium]|nr:MAG: CPBP family intramembrane metalloprotease [Calditrichota bacterium]